MPKIYEKPSKVCENLGVRLSPGDRRNGRAGVTEHDRARAIAAVRRCGADGLLSTREVEDRIEQMFRARKRADLDAALSGLPHSLHVAAEMFLTHGFTAHAAKPEAPWWRGILLWSLAVDVFWVIVWLFTGGGAGWLVVGIVSTTIAFTFRLVARHRRHLGGPSSRRRRLL